MQRHSNAKQWLVLAACSAAMAAQAGTVWDEAVNGDLSSNGLAPTVLAMAAGSNQVLGTTGDAGQGVDRDYFSFTVPTGMALTSITLLGSTVVSGGASFIGMQLGPQITVAPSGAGAAALLGFMHYSGDQIGNDLLPSVAAGHAMLPSGTYAVWVQETGGPATYGFDFVLSAVPEPGAGLLLLAGITGLAALRRKAR